MSKYDFTFYYSEGSVQLKVWNRYGAVYDKYYPQTYTPQECIEDYCDSLGWGFVSCVIEDHENIGLRGSFDFVTCPDKFVFSGDVLVSAEWVLR